jgi:OmpA-OmpF porin, OOP family
MKIFTCISIAFLLTFWAALNEVSAQVINPKHTAKEQGTNRVNSKIEGGIDAGFNKVEEGIGGLLKKKKQNENETSQPDDQYEDEQVENEPEDEPAAQPQNQQPKLTSTTQYDFVPGDKILYFEDFSQDAVGDFPALWSCNGGGEVKTVNIAPGNWFHMNGEDAVYCYLNQVDFPENFIIEYDIIPDEEYSYGIQFSLYKDYPDEAKELNDDLYPGEGGLHVRIKKDGWETRGYRNEDNSDNFDGQASKNPVVTEQVNHVIMWVQKRRVRIYHQGAKVLDVPTNIHTNTTFNRLRFSGWDSYSHPMISNFKITTASPDTRSKLITEGKLVTYGITFDVNKADIKPESYGTLKSIADVLKENASVRVTISGHTDSDGDDALNLDLSKRRAEAVKNELVSTFGIESSRMETQGAGESKPVAPNDTPANKAQNRRVEFIKI